MSGGDEMIEKKRMVWMRERHLGGKQLALDTNSRTSELHPAEKHSPCTQINKLLLK